MLNFCLQIDIGHGVKPPGYYIQRIGGLFPAAYPQDSPDMHNIEQLFQFLGTLLAKCLQDKRIIDIPLSRPFLKLMCMGEVGHHITQQYTQSLHRSVGSSMESYHSDLPSSNTTSYTTSYSIEDMDKELILDPPKPKHPETPAWYTGILNDDDFEIIDTHRAIFLCQLKDLANQKQKILKDRTLTPDQKNILIQQLGLRNPQDPEERYRLEDLGYVIMYNNIIVFIVNWVLVKVTRAQTYRAGQCLPGWWIGGALFFFFVCLYIYLYFS